MKLELTIPQKGLLLVGILFTGEIVMLGVHLMLLQNAELQAESETHARNVIYKFYESGKNRVDAASSIFGYGLSRDIVFLHNYEESVAYHAGITDQLRQLMKTPTEAQEFRDFNECNEQIFQILYKTRQLIDDEKFGFLEAAKIRRALESTVQHARAQDDSIVHRYKKEQDRSSKAAQLFRNMMRWLLISGIGLNIVAALLLSRAFSLDIVERLKILMDNTNRLAQKKPLNQPLQGHDEISQLDNVFHEMAGALAEAEKLKTDLFNMVSHDLRTPLTSIEGSLSYLTSKSDAAMPAEARELVERAERNARQLLRLVNDLLDIQKLSAGKLPLKLTEVRLTDVFENAAVSVNALAKQQKITIEADLKDLTVYSDKERLLQVFINLLSNAIKFSPPESKISVSAMADNNDVWIKFADRGRGVPPDQLALIFEPFHQVSSTDSENRKGSGLGLSICREIISAAGGSLSVESELGKGTTYTIRLPKTSA